jgi:omega-3 fatty acid desaturase (delta-15 desaturase)
MVKDLALIATSFWVYPYCSHSWLLLLVYWNVYGFLMWCLFVVGHDCGHGSFSKSPVINAICGHFCHTPLFVPFFPWAYSHRKHHQFHNHVQKDTSHPWFTEDKLKSLSFGNYFLKSFIAPFFGFWAYLYEGSFDGSHIIPTSRLFKEAPKSEKFKCMISALSILGFASLLYLAFSSWTEVMLRYGGCLVFFSFWLFMVTYMHHHHEDILVFDDSNWTFIDGGLETIDRVYGFGIDKLHHNISDCHVAHHLFFTQIPHYHLKKATKAIAAFLGSQYKFQQHTFFLKDFWKLFFKVHFTKWTLKSSPKKQPAPENTIKTES